VSIYPAGRVEQGADVGRFLFSRVCDTKSVKLVEHVSQDKNGRCHVRTRLIRQLAVFFVAAFFLLGAAAPQSRPLVLAVATEPSTLDGQAVIDRNSRVASGNIFESLLDRDRSGQIVPWLAESYRAVNDTTWRFRLTLQR
jgi:hypothetical protein